MARQQTHSSRVKQVEGSVLVGLGILVVLGSLDWAAARFERTLCGATGEALRVLTGIVLSVWQAAQAGVPAQHRFADCVFHLVLTVPHFVLVLGGAI